MLEATGPETSELYVRLRINARIGKRAPAIVGSGAQRFDRFTVRIMIAGLKERIA